MYRPFQLGGSWCFRPFGQTLRLHLMLETVCRAMYEVYQDKDEYMAKEEVFFTPH